MKWNFSCMMMCVSVEGLYYSRGIWERRQILQLLFPTPLKITSAQLQEWWQAIVIQSRLISYSNSHFLFLNLLSFQTQKDKKSTAAVLTLLRKRLETRLGGQLRDKFLRSFTGHFTLLPLINPRITSKDICGQTHTKKQVTTSPLL